MKIYLTLLWLTTSLMPLRCEEQLTIQPPPELQNFTEIDGERAIYFTRDNWIAFSAWMWEDRAAHGERVAAETARPPLVEIAGLMAERDEAVKQNRRATLWKWTAVVAVAIAVVEGAALLFR